MNAAVSIVLLAAVLGVDVYKRQVQHFQRQLGQHHGSKDQHAAKDFPGRKVLVQQLSLIHISRSSSSFGFWLGRARRVSK